MLPTLQLPHPSDAGPELGHPLPPASALRGRQGEVLARAHLEQLGYTVVEANVRCGGGELDVIAWDERVLCFIEVRTRASAAWGDPLETLGPEKLRTLVRAATAYLARIPHPWPPFRFDAIGILLPNGAATAADITLVRHAFEA